MFGFKSKPAPAADATPPKPGLMQRLRARLNQGNSWLTFDLGNLLPGGRIDATVLDELEMRLITADGRADYLVVDPEIRSSGLGTALVQHLEGLAREEGCNLAVLDSYTSNHPSHRLYHRLGFEIWGFHFVKPLGPLDR